MRKKLVYLILAVLPLATKVANADVFRWDDDAVIPGTEGIVPGPHIAMDHLQLVAADFRNRDLTNARLAGCNRTSASFREATLTNVDFHDATISQTNFVDAMDFRPDQLYSTAGYRAQHLSGISLFGLDLAGWDYTGQDLSRANLMDASLPGAKFNGATVLPVK